MGKFQIIVVLNCSLQTYLNLGVLSMCVTSTHP